LFDCLIVWLIVCLLFVRLFICSLAPLICSVVGCLFVCSLVGWLITIYLFIYNVPLISCNKVIKAFWQESNLRACDYNIPSTNWKPHLLIIPYVYLSGEMPQTLDI
jgi:hypothetical protein